MSTQDVFISTTPSHHPLLPPCSHNGSSRPLSPSGNTACSIQGDDEGGGSGIGGGEVVVLGDGVSLCSRQLIPALPSCPSASRHAVSFI